MAHAQQIEYCNNIKNKYPMHFQYKKVLDAGSLDINGNNNYLFENCSYIGVDLEFGNNVDLKSKICDLAFRDLFFDTIVCTELLEHDPTYYLTLNNLFRMLNSNGLMLLTCATTNRNEHGTIKANSCDSPFTSNIPIWANYYKNLTENDIRFCLDVDSLFAEYEFTVNNENFDLYFYGIKK